MRFHSRFHFVILVAVAMLWAAPARSRGRNGASSFPGAAFSANESTARWLADYDRGA